MSKPHGFPKSLRLGSKKEIDRVFRQGRYHKLGTLQAKTLPNGLLESRFMISVKKAVGTAPERNRAKRVVREAVRLNQNRLDVSHDVCFFLTCRPERPPSLSAIEQEIQSLFDRLSHNRDSLASNG